MHATARQLADEALRLFLERGYDNVTTADIAAAAGVTPRTLFRHFATKDEMLFADAEVETVDFVNRLYAQPIDRPVTVALVDTIRAHQEQYPPTEDDIARYRIVLATPSLADASLAYSARFERSLAEWIAQRHRRDPDDLDVRVIAAALVAARRVVAEEWLASDFESDITDLAARAIAVIDTSTLDTRIAERPRR